MVGLAKNFLQSFRPHFGLKIRGGGGQAPAVDAPLLQVAINKNPPMSFQKEIMDLKFENNIETDKYSALKTSWKKMAKIGNLIR